MNNKLAAFVLLASASIALALDPSAPVVREAGGVIVQTAERIPAVFGSTYPYDNAGDEAWARDGWRNRTAQELADEAEAAELAESARVVTMAQAYGPLVAALELYLGDVGWTIPCEADAVLADLLSRSVSRQLTDEQERAHGKIADLYTILSSRGISNADIAAIWKAIGGNQ